MYKFLKNIKTLSAGQNPKNAYKCKETRMCAMKKKKGTIENNVKFERMLSETRDFVFRYHFINIIYLRALPCTILVYRRSYTAQ